MTSSTDGSSAACASAQFGARRIEAATPGDRVVFFEQQDARPLAVIGKRGLVLAVAELAADFFAQPQLFHHPLEADQRAHAGE
jgi:hypothetical protein